MKWGAQETSHKRGDDQDSPYKHAVKESTWPTPSGAVHSSWGMRQGTVPSISRLWCHLTNDQLWNLCHKHLELLCRQEMGSGGHPHPGACGWRWGWKEVTPLTSPTPDLLISLITHSPLMLMLISALHQSLSAVQVPKQIQVSHQQTVSESTSVAKQDPRPPTFLGFSHLFLAPRFVLYSLRQPFTVKIECAES